MQTKFCSMSLNKWIQLNFFVFHLFSLFVALFPYRMCERRSCAHFMFFHSCVVSAMWEELLEFLVRKCRWHRHRSQPLSPRIITLSIEFCFNFSFFPLSCCFFFFSFFWWWNAWSNSIQRHVFWKLMKAVLMLFHTFMFLYALTL